MGRNRNRNRSVSVAGLANIGALLNKADPLPAPPPRAEKRSRDAIVEKTLGWLGEGASATYRRYVEAAVRDAYNLGHADALTQNNMVEDLLKKQYEARTNLTMPAVVAAVMEQCGMDHLMLDMEAVSTVFTRCQLGMNVDQPNGGDIVEYNLSFLADAAPDNTYSLPG